MGLFHFQTPASHSEFLNSSHWQDAYICGIEGIPWQCQTSLQDDQLTIRRSIDASGKLNIVSPVPGIGLRSLSTCSLRGGRVYQLPLELARGSCFRLQNQTDVWTRTGLTLDEEFRGLAAAGTERFLHAIQSRCDPDRSAAQSIEAIGLLEQAITRLGEAYAVQSITYRKRQEPQIGTLLAATLIPPVAGLSPRAADYLSTFNAAAVRLNWAEIENDAGRYDFDHAKTTIAWCGQHGLRVIGGPLIDFRERLMPHWLYLLEGNFEGFVSSVLQFVESTVQELRGTVQLWNCASGLNTPGPIRLDDERAMRLAVGILQAVRRLDPNTPAIISFDEPFGEYLAKDRDGISPLHFADAIARSGLGIAGFGLDIHTHYSGGTPPRSAVDFGAMIDRWATLGLPLLVSLGVPAGTGMDAAAIAPDGVYWPTSDTTDFAGAQLRIAQPMLQTLLAKHAVHGIVWDGWSDATPHVHSHSGLIDSQNRPRPLLEYVKRLRKEFLT